VTEIYSLNQLFNEPVDNLFKLLKSLWKKEFLENERIVFSHNGCIPQQAVDHLQRIITHLDITNCFVLLVTNDRDIDAKLKLAQTQWTHDDTSVETWLTEFDLPVTPLYDVSKFILPTNMCISPWAKLEIGAAGTAQPCCAYSGQITDTSGIAYNVTTHSIDEIYFSKELTDLRSQFLRGEKSNKCSQCWKDEDAGVTSIRQHTLWNLNSELYNIDWHTESTDNLKSIALALGNICNLKCRVCHPNSSSSMAAEQLKQLPPKDRKSSQLYALQKNKSWIKQELKLWNDYHKLAPSLSEMRFTGGEPMLINKQFDLVKTIAQTNDAKHITLRYVSNGTVFPEHIIDHWKKYQEVEISLSIDDINERFEYQRYGAVWKEVQQNINRYQMLKDELNIVVMVNCTVTSMNVLYLPEICDWFDKIEFDHVRLNLLYSPSALSILTLPNGVKKHVTSRLSESKFSNLFDAQIQAIINAINLSPSDSDTNAVVQKIKEVDQIRNQKFSDAHAEMAQLINYNA
jgi:MoaA/NifB/PqqE/SkfB family radical SAM enzyme